MIKKDISYTDYNGVKRTKTFYFNFSMGEIVEMEADIDGGYSDFIKKIIESQDARNLISEFKKFLLKAVGQKSEDGERFVKSDAIRDEFVQTPAFDALFLELISNTDAAATFIVGALPREFEEEIRKQAAAANIPMPKPAISPFAAPPTPSDPPISH